MSAFVVNKLHIDALVTYAVQNRMSYWWNHQHNEINVSTADNIGKILLAENQRSVNYRYGDNDPAPIYKFNRYKRQLSAIEVIKACNCLDHQSCETDDWEKSEAFKIVNTILVHAIDYLPGYEQAAWEIAN